MQEQHQPPGPYTTSLFSFHVKPAFNEQSARQANPRFTFRHRQVHVHVKPQLNRSRHQTTDEVWQSLNVRGVSSCSQPSSWRPICQPQTTVWAETMTSIRRRTTGGLLLRTIRFDERGILVPRCMNAFGAPLTMKGVEATTLECCLTTQPRSREPIHHLHIQFKGWLL